MLKTRFTELVGCSIPIQQAGMGTLTNPVLAAAISNAGALGMLSVAGLTPEDVAKRLNAVRERTSGPFGANFLMPFVDPADAHACVAAAAARARVIDFFLRRPGPGPDRDRPCSGGAGCMADWFARGSHGRR